jgi:DNA-binding FadR family transcriptional regulator
MNTYARRGIHGHVVNELGLSITRGLLKTGTVIDPNELVRSFGVSRTVIREALKVLATKGLVDARPKRGTFITERSQWQLLDGDVIRWRSGKEPDPLLLVELGEVRLAIEPLAARMAATRRTDEHLEAMAAALSLMADARPENRDAIVSADVSFHSALLRAAGNELLERFEVLLEPALEARDALAHSHSDDVAFFGLHQLVFEAIRDFKPDVAQGVMTEMMTLAIRDAEQALASVASAKDLLASRKAAI